MKHIESCLYEIREIINDKDHPERELVEYAYMTLLLERGDSNPYYSLLRKGLDKQFERELKEPLLNLIKSEEDEILDVGCSNGLMVDTLTERFPSKTILGIDNKTTSCFKGRYPEDLKDRKFNLIIMKEFLHLFTYAKVIRYINQSKELLKEKGRILIIENEYSEYLDDRLNRLGGGGCITSKQLECFPTFEILLRTENYWIGEIR